jgi:hypothetical protein
MTLLGARALPQVRTYADEDQLFNSPEAACGNWHGWDQVNNSLLSVLS